jgi:hypothetical protein
METSIDPNQVMRENIEVAQTKQEYPSKFKFSKYCG